MYFPESTKQLKNKRFDRGADLGNRVLWPRKAGSGPINGEPYLLNKTPCHIFY